MARGRNSITWEGVPAMQRALKKVGSEARKGAEQAVAAEVKAVEHDARRIAPHDTGDLEHHIDGEAHGLDGTVKSTSRHAGFVEHGTYKDKAQPYMKPAAELSRRRLPRRAADIIRAHLGVS